MEDQEMSCLTEVNEGELEMEEVNEDVESEMVVPHGYRFRPRDHEIIEQYLMPRVHNEYYPPDIVYEVELYKHDPEYFAEKLRAMDGKAWYFFTPRNRKYKTGERPDRSAGGGFWKASGKEEEIIHKRKLIGYKRTLVLCKGKGSAAERTNWLMHEYTLKDPPQRQRNGPQDMILDDCVLCKVYKNERGEKNKSAVAVQPLHQSAVAFPPPVYGSNISHNMNPGLQGGGFAADYRRLPPLLNQQNQTANNVIHQNATNLVHHQPVASYQDDTSIQNNSNTMNQNAAAAAFRAFNQHAGGQSNFNQYPAGQTNAFLYPNQINVNQHPTHISYHPDPPEPTTSQSSENTVKLEQPSP